MKIGERGFVNIRQERTEGQDRGGLGGKKERVEDERIERHHPLSGFVLLNFIGCILVNYRPKSKEDIIA